MATEYDNSGALFKNDKKEKDTHPDYTGNATIDGTPYWMSAWVKTAKSGKKFMSFAFKLKEERPVAQDVKGADETEDDLPF